MIEELPQANGEDEIAEASVLQTGQHERLRRIIGEGKEETSEATEEYGKPIPKDDMDKAEGQRADHDHQPAVPEKRFVTPKQEGTVEEFLREDGKHGVEKLNQEPEGGGTLDERKEEFRGKEPNGHGEGQQTESVAQKGAERHGETLARENSAEL